MRRSMPEVPSPLCTTRVHPSAPHPVYSSSEGPQSLGRISPAYPRFGGGITAKWTPRRDENMKYVRWNWNMCLIRYSGNASEFRVCALKSCPFGGLGSRFGWLFHRKNRVTIVRKFRRWMCYVETWSRSVNVFDFPRNIFDAKITKLFRFVINLIPRKKYEWNRPFRS